MKRKHQKILGGTLIFIALYSILFSGTPRFSAQGAEHMLADVSAYFSKEATKRNQEAKLQYSEVEIHGFAYEKWARISNLSLDWMLQQWHGPARFGISTASANLTPDPVSKNRMTFTLGDAINFIAGSELIARVEPSSPLLYAITRPRNPSDAHVVHHLNLPSHIRITTPEPKREMLLSLAPKSFAEATLFDAQNHARAKVVAGDIQLREGDKQWNSKSAELHYDSLQNTSEKTESKGTITLDQLRFTRGASTTTPFTLNTAWAMKEQHTISGATDAISLALEQCLLADGKVKISVNGTLTMEIDDAMYGELEIEINDVHQFVGSRLIAPDKQALALALLGEIMDADMNTRHQTIITIRREKNGTWMVGKMPLSTLLDKGFLSIFIFSE
jgi:hypothetical protein